MGHMGDIAWEVFEAGDNGERMRDLQSMDRDEVIAQLQDVRFKACSSLGMGCLPAIVLFDT